MANKKSRKKKRISKHVLKAKDASTSSMEGSGVDNKKPVTTKLEKSTKKTKDPKEAIAYLSAWKYREQGGGTWKFNKNTQSWILRHMYDIDKISKVTFVVLLEYLDGLKGLSRRRVLDDGNRRALRYKKFEKELSLREKSSEDDNKVDQESEKPENNSGKDSNLNEFPTDGEDDETRWDRLSDHDKRKEYKRARKVIELLQEEQVTHKA